MSTTSISRINAVQVEAGIQAEKDAKSDVDRAMSEQRKKIDESYDKNKQEIGENREAREKENKGALLGTIFGGFLIGSLIGKAIGNAAGDGNKENAQKYKKETGVADLMYDKSKDRADEARKQQEEAQSRQKDVEKFGDELNDSKFIGIS